MAFYKLQILDLAQCVGTGAYFGRVKIEGKGFSESLGATVFTTAKLRPPDFIQKKRRPPAYHSMTSWHNARWQNLGNQVTSRKLGNEPGNKYAKRGGQKQKVRGIETPSCKLGRRHRSHPRPRLQK
jgi:hypothetical protein